MNKKIFSKPELEFIEIDNTDIITTSIRTCTVDVWNCSCKCYLASHGGENIVYHWDDVCAGQACWDAWTARGYTNQKMLGRNYN